MAVISACSNCGNTKKGNSAKRCSQCGEVTCQKCSFSKCICGSSSYDRQYTIG